MEYVGHISEDGRKQLLLEHLQGTACLCKHFANEFKMEKIGNVLGLYHDIGKYSVGFQNRILNNGPKVDHSTAGAQVAFASNQCIGSLLVAMCIAGHHSGLMNRGSKKSANDGTLVARLKKTLSGKTAFEAYKAEVPLLSGDVFQPIQDFAGIDYFSYMLLTRMLYSSLVDADYLDTEKFMSDGKVIRGDFDSITKLYERYNEYVTKFDPNSSAINVKRCEIREECISAGKGDAGLYSLTVPTGGGKTIASLGFALEQAINTNHPKNRIIYVIPYTSIIEQTADVFREILGSSNVVEHHMNVDYGSGELNTNAEIEQKKLATENWDAPVIVTTNVQFFESLYGCKSSKCRKLHNIANSVVIFDEVQMLPNAFLKPCVRVIEELVNKYGVTAVLCTATQPSLNRYFSKKLQCREIISDVQGLYEFFKRVSYKKLEFTDIEDLAVELNSKEQVLCIVNSKKDAQEIFEKLDGDNCFHLTTSMCPTHRRKVLKKVRECLDNEVPCRLVATSLVEAGVDLDFPVVYREMAGIDNIIQAGGRCNRNNLYDVSDSWVNVFTLKEGGRKLPAYIRLPKEVAEMIFREFADISSVDAIKEYFDKLHNFKSGKIGVNGDGLDIYGLVNPENVKEFAFADVARDFVLIDENGYSIFIPYDDNGKEILKQLKMGVRNRDLMRKAGQYVVNVYENQYKFLEGQGVLERLDESISVLLDCDKYSEDVGLMTNVEDGIGVFL